MNAQLTHLLQNKGLQSPQKALVYIIQRGDSLSQIIRQHYKAVPNTPDYRVAEATILEFNHHITHPDRIFAGDVIRLMPLPDIYSADSCLAPETYNQPDFMATRQFLEPLHSGGVNAFGNLVGQGNSELIREITDIHEDFKADKMSRNQYDYRRQKVVKKIAGRMGPIFQRNQLRIDQRKGIVPTHRIETHANHIAKLSRLANAGGIALAGAGAVLSCNEIANTEDRQEKNEIFVETAASTGVGLVAGYAVTALLISNPVGWGIAIVLGVGTAATAFGVGKYAKKYFKKPHFTSAELALFSHFPGTLIRTGIFMNLCVFPRFGGKRQMLDIRENVPQWYIVSARCFVFLFTINALSLILLFIGLIIFIEFFKS